MNELALFAGAGGGILGSHLLGWRTCCAVEIEDYPRRVLLQRQADGILPKFPIWDDVTTFDGTEWRGRIDVITGGFPCQDISVAGKGAGLDGERSGLWKEMARIIGEVRPRFVFVENSPALTSRGLGTVLGDLATLGYDARWGVLGADDAGAPHRRKRIWILAYTRQKYVSQGDATRLEASKTIGTAGTVHNQSSSKGQGEVANTDKAGCKELHTSTKPDGERQYPGKDIEGWWQTDPADGPEPELGRVVDGVAHRVDRLAAIGNGQVPAVVRLAWRILNANPS
jgi:DNA (cytosine-5)-methyltransferase 1